MEITSNLYAKLVLVNGLFFLHLKFTINSFFFAVIYEVAFLSIFTMQKKSMNLELHTMITCPKLQGLLHDPTYSFFSTTTL
jgi:hypothetical protein